jgi:hypothetical protein
MDHEITCDRQHALQIVYPNAGVAGRRMSASAAEQVIRPICGSLQFLCRCPGIRQSNLS